MRNIRNFRGWHHMFCSSLIPVCFNSAIHRTLTCTAVFCRGTATSNGWVCSSRGTWLFSRSWRNNPVAIYRATIRRPVCGSLHSCFPGVEVSDPASFAPRICPPRTSGIKNHVTCFIVYPAPKQIFLCQKLILKII